MHAARPGGVPASHWPFVGRTEELALIAAARDRGTTCGVVLTGPAGVGKSSIARSAARAAEQAGARLTWVHATRSAATIPMGAFAGLIEPGTSADDTIGLMHAAVAALRSGAEERPVVLGVDDVHLLDPTSAALVLHIAISRSAFLIVTMRSGVPRPDAVEGLWKDAGALVIDLTALEAVETGRVVEDALDGPAEERVRRWAVSGSRGNPLYLRELLTGALADGALESREGFWRLTRDPPPSTTLTELIETRMEGIATEERRALGLLALGEPLRLGELTELVGAEAVAELELRGLLEVGGSAADSAVWLAHPLYGEVVRASMPMVRGRAARMQLAAVVRARADQSADDRLRVARWLLDAGEPVETGLALDAAAAANLAGDAELGARLARIALDGGAGTRAAMILARAHAMNQRFAEAETVLAEAEEELLARTRPPDGDEQELALEALEHRFSLLYWRLHRPEEAIRLSDRALAWWPDPEWRIRVQAARLSLLMWNEHATVIAGADRLLADPALPRPMRPRIELARAGALFYAGRGREASALAATVRPAVPLRGTHEHLAMDICAMIDLDTGEDLQAAERWLGTTFAASLTAHDHVGAGISALTLAELHVLGGRLQRADRWLAEANAQLDRRDPFAYRRLAYTLATIIASERGDHEAAAAAAARHRSLTLEPIAAETDRSEIPYAARTEALGLLADGDVTGAQALLLDAADRCASLVLPALRLLYDALRAGARPKLIAERAEPIAARCDARLPAALVAHIRARAAQDASGLLEAAEQLAATGAVRFASECAAHAAETFASDGRPDSARQAARRSQELHALCDGVSPPDISGLQAGTIALTPREAQFVELAARGLSNAEIADRLVLSVRTVESHLYRAMRKLGIGDRRELKLQQDPDPQ
jgi:DNA-binding CsgD family transcriptional regulator